MNYYECKYFKTHEILPQKIDQMINNEIVKYSMFDPRVLIFLDWARDRYGSLTVNDYTWGGSNQWRGLRTPDSKYYSKNSMHSFGKAVDFVSERFSAQEIITDLKELSKRGKAPEISRVEDLEGMTWVHGDTKNTNREGIYFFKP